MADIRLVTIDRFQICSMVERKRIRTVADNWPVLLMELMKVKVLVSAICLVNISPCGELGDQRTRIPGQWLKEDAIDRN